MAKEDGQQSDDIKATARQEWRSYMEGLIPVVDQFVDRLTDPADARLRHELYRQCVGQIAAGYFGLLYADARHPDFWPYFSSAFSHLGPNPDNDWYVTPVDDWGVYRISGYRGTVKRVDFQLGTGTFTPRGALDEDGHGKTTANYDVDSLAISPNGSFEVILSPTRPADHKGEWWQLHPRTSCIMVRQISYDWINEIDARLAIERLDTPTVKPRAGVAELSENLRQLSTWVPTNVKTAFDFVQEFRNAGWVNKVGYKDLTDWGSITTQRYVYGIFELEEDEALIFECDIPDVSRYWSIQLTDELLVSVDWMNRQSSINGHTAKLDRDGRFRAVISARDPGIANWLDTAGYRVGTIQNRWDSCSSWPSPNTRKVKFDHIHDHLFPNTALVSAAERDAAIRLRRRACQLRKRW
jgi:hypothetical protein